MTELNEYAVLGPDGGYQASAFMLACMRRAAGFDTELPVVPHHLKQGVFHLSRLNKLGGVVNSQAAEQLGSLFERYLQQTISLNGAVIKETIAIHGILSEARMQHVFLKGPLQQKLVHGTPFMKPSGDIDILVPRRHFRSACLLFESKGYQAEKDTFWWRNFLGELHLIRPGSIPKLDVHHRINQPGIPQVLDAAALVEHASAVTIGGAELPVLEARKAMLLSAVSIAKALLGRKACGDYVFDFQVQMGRLDAQASSDLDAVARRHGLYGALALASRVTKAVFAPADGSSYAVLPSLTDTAIAGLVMTPWRTDIVWPRRRELLDVLCMERLNRRAPEMAWLATGEMARRITERWPRGRRRAGAVTAGPSTKTAAEPKVSGASSVTVVIAARNVAGTIRRAMDSALAELEVEEIIVVDDASSDGTAAIVESIDAPGRVRLIRLPANRGPSFARNRALESIRTPYVSILDADDFVLRGRYASMLKTTDWDVIADNIIFVDQKGDHSKLVPPVATGQAELLDLTGFVTGNLTRRGVHRGELGFLKPVMSRHFLEANGLRYDDNVRLGEDYDLYARALAAGARFKVVQSCGYAAVVYPSSLSASHRTEDLRQLADVDGRLLRLLPEDHDALAAIGRHERQTRDKYHLREFLDRKAVSLGDALSYAVSGPAIFRAVSCGIAADKVGHALARATSRLGLRTDPSLPRYLLPILGEPR